MPIRMPGNTAQVYTVLSLSLDTASPISRPQIRHSTTHAPKVRCPLSFLPNSRLTSISDVPDFRLHIYDTSAPPLMDGNDVRATGDGSDHETTLRTMKSINGVHGNWTITDSHLSPDNERMIYSSIVCPRNFPPH